IFLVPLGIILIWFFNSLKVLREVGLDDLLSQREKLNHRLQEILDLHTGPWGIKVALVEIKGVDLPEVMQRAMARQAEAEREKRAKVIHAQGEFEASEQLAAAAHTLSDQPIAIQLRYLQTLTEIGMEKNTTIVFPIPIDFLKYFVNREGAPSHDIAALARRASVRRDHRTNLFDESPKEIQI